jgi:hypothetical protein
VRHYRGAQNADRDVKHVFVSDDFSARDETAEHRRQIGFRENDFESETSANGQNERDDQRLDVTESFVLQIQNRQHVQDRNANPPDERELE